MSFLPPGFPAPDPETIDALRRSIRATIDTPHPPRTDELAVIICADEAGVDLAGVDPEMLWRSPPDERQPVFEALGQLLGEALG